MAYPQKNEAPGVLSEATSVAVPSEDGKEDSQRSEVGAAACKRLFFLAVAHSAVARWAFSNSIVLFPLLFQRECKGVPPFHARPFFI